MKTFRNPGLLSKRTARKDGNYTDDTAKVVFDHAEFGYTTAPLLKDFSIAVDEG